MQIQPSQIEQEREDIFFGQIVIVWARWFIILAGVIYALWLSTSVTQLTLAIGLLASIIGINFYIHGRYLMEKPVNQTILQFLSAVDLTFITLLIVIGPGQHGLANNLFIFYYPLLAAFAFVFPPNLSAVYTGAALIIYAGACLIITPSLIGDSAGLELLLMRLITMGAVGGLSTYYWRIQRKRRRLVAERPLTG